jgi:NagD protein
MSRRPDCAAVRARVEAARGYVFDLDGSLVLGDKSNNALTALPGAAALLELLDARRIPWLVMTNGTVRTPAGISLELAKAGLPVPAGKIVTPATVAAAYFKSRKMSTIIVLGVEGVWQPIADAGLEVVLPAEGDAGAESADAIFVGWYRQVHMDEIEVACNAIWRGARLYCASMVPYFAVRHGRALGSSRAIAAMITSVTGRRATTLGKPSLHALRTAANLIGCKPSELVVVGDDPDLEVRMALAGNALAVGVHTGIAGAAGFAALPPERQPQLSFADVAGLGDYLGGSDIVVKRYHGHSRARHFTD